MAELSIRSALDAIEGAINRDEKDDALAILQNARDVLAETPEEISPLKQRLSTELDRACLAMERLDSVINLIATALYKRDTDKDYGMAVCLQNTAEADLNSAMDRIHAAIALLTQIRAARGALGG